MKQLTLAFLLCASPIFASQTGTYTVDANNWVVYDRDIKQDDLKIEIETDTYNSKSLFDNLKGWFE